MSGDAKLIIKFDGHELDKLADLLRRAPHDMLYKAFGAASRRVGSSAKTAVGRDIAGLTNLPVRTVAQYMRSTVNRNGDITIRVRSRQLSLVKTGPVSQYGGSGDNPGGVKTLRGSYKEAFIASMSNGHKGVFKKSKQSPGRIFEIYGPNPANAVTNALPRYQKLAEGIIEEKLLPRLEHELKRRLTLLGK